MFTTNRSRRALPLRRKIIILVVNVIAEEKLIDVDFFTRYIEINLVLSKRTLQPNGDNDVQSERGQQKRQHERVDDIPHRAEVIACSLLKQLFHFFPNPP